jgi:predicted nuclease with TOPRIM domain
VKSKEAAHEDDFLHVVTDLKSQLRGKNEHISSQAEELKQLKQELEDKSRELREAQTAMQVLEERLGDMDPGPIQRKVARPGPQLKHWEDLSQKQKARETKEILDRLSITAEKRGTTSTTMAGYIVHR